MPSAASNSSDQLSFQIERSVGSVAVVPPVSAVEPPALPPLAVPAVPALLNGDESWELPMPGTFVLDAKGVVQLANVDSDFTSRLEPARILQALQKLRA